MRQYTTLFDRNYLAKGLCLYDSLKRHSSEAFTLNILCMDKETAVLLDSMKLDHAQLFPLAAFEQALQLGAIRQTRSWTEYCWSLASVFTDYMMVTLAEDVTYLDADLFFFSDPKVIFEEIGSRSVGVTPHRLIPSKRHLEVNGAFNVGWVTFRCDSIGRECLRRWAQQCRARCSAKVGCGDQQYLDDWPAKYGEQLCIIENIGVNAAPWNIGNWEVNDGPTVNRIPVVCFHFHEWFQRDDGSIRFSNYALRDEDLQLIYAPYVEAYQTAKAQISAFEVLRMLTQSVLKMEAERA